MADNTITTTQADELLPTVVEAITAENEATAEYQRSSAQLRYDTGKAVRDYFLARMAAARKGSDMAAVREAATKRIQGAIKAAKQADEVYRMETDDDGQPVGKKLRKADYNVTRALKQWALCTLNADALTLPATAAERLHSFVSINWRNDGAAEWKDDTCQKEGNRIIKAATEKDWTAAKVQEQVETFQAGLLSPEQEAEREAKRRAKALEQLAEQLDELDDSALTTILRNDKRRERILAAVAKAQAA